MFQREIKSTYKMTRVVQKRDSGYGWVIVWAFFIIELLVDGVRFTFGLYFVEFLAEFEKSKADTAWIGGIMMGVYNLGGPSFAFILKKTGCRLASIIGTLTAVTGLILSSFTTNLFHLYFSYGLLPGVGYGLIFLSGTVAISRYFLKKRAIAIGISYCGSGVGMFAISPLVRLLFETYTWRGSLFILAGLILNCCVFSSLYRPFMGVDVSEDDECDDIKSDKEPLENGTSLTVSRAPCGYNSAEIQSPLLNDENNSRQDMLGNGKKEILPSHPRSFADMRKEELDLLKEGHRHRSRGSINKVVNSQSIFGSNASFQHIFEKRYNSKNSDLSLHSSPFGKNGPMLLEKRFKNQFIENIFPKELLTNVNFIIMMTATLSAGIPSFIPFSMLPDFAMTTGSTHSQGAWLLSVIGIGGTIGRIGAGVLSDLSCVHSLTLNSVCYLIIGVMTIVAAVIPTFGVLITYAGTFGVFYGAIYVVQPIVLIEYLSERYISEVMGLTMLTYGVATLIGNPVAGWIFDITGSYRTTFLVAGGLFTLGGVINFLVLCTKQRQTVTEEVPEEHSIIIEDKTASMLKIQSSG